MAATKEKLPFGVKAGYGVGETGVFIVEMLVRLHLLKFYTDVVGLRAELAGLAAALAIIWDGMTDPLMGMISDRTRSRMGKRRPFILAGGFLMALAVLALLLPPDTNSEWLLFAYLMITYILLNTAMTIIAVPHSALAGELTFDRHIRIELFAYRLFSGNIGLILGAGLPGFFVSRYSSESDAYFYAGIAISAVIVAATIITVVATSGHDHSGSESDSDVVGLKTIIGSTKSLLTNKIFMPLLGAYAIAYIGVSINSAIALYYYEYRLKLEQASTDLILVVFIVVWSLSLVGWILISRKYGKKWPGFTGVFLLGVATCVTYPFFPEGEPVYPMIMAVAGGILVGSIVLLDSLVADIVDYDELKTGKHREGLFFGFWKLAIKVSRAVSLGLSGLMLALIGFVPNQEQTQEVSDRLGFFFGPGVGAFFIIGSLIFLFMPMTDDMHVRIQKLLTKKRKLKEKHS